MTPPIAARHRASFVEPTKPTRLEALFVTESDERIGLGCAAGGKQAGG